MAELGTCGQSKPTARSRPDKPRDTSTKSTCLVSSSTSSTPVVRETAGIMWRRIENRGCDGSIGGGKTRNRIEWEPGHMEL